MSPIARCSCDGNTCRCLVQAGDGIVITGSGQSADPYIVESTITGFAGSLIGQDTDSVDVTVVGQGTAMDPFVISARTSVKMTTLADVVDPAGPALGEVPVFNGVAWEFAAPPTVPPGQVSTGGGILGDGTLANPITVAVSDTTETSTSGLGIYVDSAGKLRANASTISSNLIRSNATTTRRQAITSDTAGRVFVVQTMVAGTATDVVRFDEEGTMRVGWVPWDQVTQRPTVFTPAAHTQSAATILNANSLGQDQRTFNDVVGSRLASLAGGSGYAEKANRGGLTGRAVMDITSANNIGLRWNGNRLVGRVDATEWEMAFLVDVNNVAAGLGSKANAYESVNDVRFAQGPTGGAYNRGMQGSGWFSVWMDNTLQFGRNTSSRRFKEDIEPFEITMDQVLALGEQVVSYHRKGADDRYEVGMIAEEVNPILPWAVTWFAEPDIDPETGEPIPGMSSTEPVIDGLRYDLLSLPALVGVRGVNQRLTEEVASWKRKHDLVLARLRKIEAAVGLTNEED